MATVDIYNNLHHPCKTINTRVSAAQLIADSTDKHAAMASGRDVRDMLGLPMGGDAPKSAQKRAKPSGAVRRIRM
jgi:prolyl-tRNA editing enzyme YbaK/EbsC (Cys-tRNA(Pro) deacylase)